VKKKWMALCVIVLFLLSAFAAFWIEKPAILQSLTDTVKTTMSSKLNGEFSFEDMNISLSGRVTLTKPVITDIHHAPVLSGDSLSVQINPWNALAILQGGEAMAALETIDVERPVLHAAQQADNTWNVATLIKQSGTGADAGYRGVIRLHDGTIFASFKDGTQLTGEACNGALDLSAYPVMTIDAEVEVDQKKLTVSGRYRSMREYDMTLRGDAVDIRYAVPFIPSTADIALSGGVIENIKAHVSQSHKGFFLSGQADVRDGTGTVKGYNVSGVKGHADLTTDEVRLSHVEGLVNGQKIRTDGIIKINGDAPVFDLKLDAPSVDLSAFSLQLPITGTVGWTGSVWGSIENLSASGTVTVASADYDGLTVSNGTADVTYEHQLIQLDKVAADVAGGHVTGKGTYGIDSGDFTASVQASDISLEAIPQIPVSVTGMVSAEVTAFGNSHDSKNIQAQGQVSATSLSYNGIEADQVSAHLAYKDGIAAISEATAAIGGGSVQVSGTFDVAANTPNITFTANQIPLDTFSAWASVPMSGTVSAAGHIWGTGSQWDVAFNAKSGTIKGMPFDSLDGSLQGQGQHIVIPAIYWRYVDGSHTVTGSADLDSRAVTLRVDTAHMRIERILPVLGKGDMGLTGWADNTINIGGTLDNPSATGSFRLSEGSYSGYLYKNISAAYEVRNGILYIHNGTISAYDASINVYGSIGDALDLTIEGNQLDISRIMVTQESLPRSGMVSLKAHVSGTVKNPMASGELTAEKLVVNNMALTDVHGDFAYYDGIIRLSDLHFAQQGGAYDANIMYNTNNDRIVARGSVHNGDLADLLNLAGVPLQKVEGRLDGDISVDGTGKNPKAAFTGKLTQAYLDGHAADPTNIDVQFADGIFKINQLSLTAGDTILAAQGTYALHGTADIQVAARQFPSRILLDILGMDGIDVDTNIDFAAQLSGNGENPDADVSAQLNGGTINGVAITNASVLFNIRDGIIHLNQAYVSKEPYKASATGTIPVSALKGGRTAESMNVNVKLDHAGLDILTFLTPLVKTAQGGIEGDINVSGTLQEPQLKGTVAVNDGSIQFRDITYPLSHITGNMDFKGTNMTAALSGTMDKKGAKNPGTISLQGTASWQGWQLTKYDAVMDIDHLKVDCNYFSGPLTGHIELAPGSSYPKLSGIVEISNTTIDVPLVFTSGTASMPLELDFTVSLGDKVRLYNSALYDMLINGSVNFKGTVEHPRPSGRFEAPRGTIHYLDTNFMLTKAKADFSIHDSFLPVLDVEGHARVGQYMVLLTLRGPADNMDMMLRSDPPLTKQQIISLITLRSGGKQESSLNSADVNSLIGTGIRMTLNSLGITHELEKALSLDMLTVTTGSLNFNDKNTDISRNYYNIEMGKYLFNDFMVTAAFGLNHDDNRFGVQYSLGSRFNINAWKSESSSFIGGSYKYSFF
jgi:translocation and assembly module TamB